MGEPTADDIERWMRAASRSTNKAADIAAYVHKQLVARQPAPSEGPMEWLGPCCTHPTPGCVVCGFTPEEESRG